MNEPTTAAISGSPSNFYETRAYAAPSATQPLAPATIRRRATGPRDVKLEVLFCGVCHSDLHQVRNEWHQVMPTVYPCVPGHEIVGRVVEVGRDVRGLKEGDLAAVGCMTLVGAPEEPVSLGVFSLLFGRRRLSGSIIGGIRETQEMLDFCSERGITADIELIPISGINTAFERLLRGEVKYRFVIDMATLK